MNKIQNHENQSIVEIMKVIEILRSQKCLGSRYFKQDFFRDLTFLEFMILNEQI